MLSSVSNYIKKNVFLRQSNNDLTDNRARPGDRLEDGFLLVGDTASEKTIVNASNYTPKPTDCPPGYSEVSQNSGLPSYSDYQNQNQQNSPTIDNSDFRYGNPFQTGMPTTLSGASGSGLQHENSSPGSHEVGENSYNCAIADVPFTFGATSSVFASVNDQRMSDLLKQRTFDHACYEYDFSLEMRFLAEHGNYDGDMDWQGC